MKEIDYLFEVSWEVVNKVGGINTVIRTKARFMKELAKNFIMIGPYINKSELVFLIKQKPPKIFSEVFSELEKEYGLRFYYGKWDINAEPETILIDFNSLWSKKNEIKTWLWDNYKVDSLFCAPDFEEPIVWGWAVALFLERLVKKLKTKKVIAHFHEWLAGSALLRIKKYCPSIKTVFTTHATFLGRVIASSGRDLYREIDSINPEEEARRMNIIDKFTAERASFLAADVATTVSKITALECEKFFGRKPDVILENGIDAEGFATIEELALLHNDSRNAIREFVTYYFFPYYHFDLRHALFYYFVGRYEIHNKGIDVFIRALGKLNEKLKKENAQRTIVAFFFVPYANKGIRRDLLENKDYYLTIKNFVQSHSEEILNRVIYDLVSQKKLTVKSIFTKEFVREAKQDLWKFKREGNAPLTTHELYDEQNNEIIKLFLEEGLDNKPDDKVKVVFYPTYLSPTDGLLNLGLYKTIAGCHLGVFPSYYEPWGYTPLESIATGVPAIASDTSGFGIAIKQLKEQSIIKDGVYILNRFGKEWNEIVDNLYKLLYEFAMLDHAERVSQRIWAKMNSILFDWKHLIKNYKKAYEVALNKN